MSNLRKRSKEAYLRRQKKYGSHYWDYPPKFIEKKSPSLLDQEIKKAQNSMLLSYLNSHMREILRNNSGGCKLCGWNEYPEILVIHHRDRNPRNNQPSNLVVLCRNCHSLVHNELKEC